MDLVTITDHDHISGALSISHHRDGIVGCDVTGFYRERLQQRFNRSLIYDLCAGPHERWQRYPTWRRNHESRRLDRQRLRQD
jgi:hypothetical protein